MINKFFFTICILASYLLMESGSAYALMKEAEADNTAQQAVTETSEQKTQTSSDLAPPSVIPISDTTPAEAPKSNLSQVSERFEVGEELIVNLQVGKLDYGELFVMVREAGLFVNIEDLIAVLDFPINKYSVENGYNLRGWYISEEKTFELNLFSSSNDLGVGSISISGESVVIVPEAYFEVAGEKLFNLDLVGKWFGLSFEFDIQSLSIKAKSAEPLPAERRLERENRSLANQGYQVPEYPTYDFGYFGLSHQILDARISTSFRRDSLSARYSAVGVQDIAGFSSRFSFSGDDASIIQNGNMTLKRESLSSDLLGPMRATSVEFGDIRPSKVGSSTGGQSIGLNIKNQKLGQVYSLDATNIAGVIPDGWDVELYQNGVLVNNIIGTQGGQFEFLDIPLFGELNTFEIVKYGPQGQVQTKQLERNLDASLFDESFNYDISLSRSNSSLFPNGQNNEIVKNWFLSGSYRYGLSDTVSGTFSHLIYLDGSEQPSSFNIGANARLSSRVLSNFTLNFIDKETYGVSGNIRSRLFDQNISLGLGTTINGNSKSHTANIQMSGSLLQTPLGGIGYTNHYIGSWSSGSLYTQRLNNTLTLSGRLGYLSHSFTTATTKIQNEAYSTTSGGLTMAANRGMFNVRLSGNYDFDEFDSSLQWLNVGAAFSYKFQNNLSTQLKIDRSLQNDFSSVSLGLDWRQENYAVNARLNHNSNGDTAVSLNARFSISETPFGKGYLVSSRNITSSALVAVRIFEDVNQNFVFDENDRPIEGAKVSAKQATKFARSDEFGIALMQGVSSFRTTDLEVDQTSLDDPYLLQSTINTSLIPREGLMTLVNYPFTQGVELEGEVVLVTSEGERSILANAPIEIINSDGLVVKTIKSEFDGYFYSDILLPDLYNIRVAPGYMLRKDLLSNEDVVVEASKPGDLVAGIAVKVRRKEMKVGYQLYVASFASEYAAKALLKIYQARLDDKIFASRLYVYESALDKRFYLGFGLYEDKDVAEKECRLKLANGLVCKLRQDRFDISLSS